MFIKDYTTRLLMSPEGDASGGSTGETLEVKDPIVEEIKDPASGEQLDIPAEEEIVIDPKEFQTRIKAMETKNAELLAEKRKAVEATKEFEAKLKALETQSLEQKKQQAIDNNDPVALKKIMADQKAIDEQLLAEKEAKHQEVVGSKDAEIAELRGQLKDIERTAMENHVWNTFKTRLGGKLVNPVLAKSVAELDRFQLDDNGNFIEDGVNQAVNNFLRDHPYLMENSGIPIPSDAPKVKEASSDMTTYQMLQNIGKIK